MEYKHFLRLVLPTDSALRSVAIHRETYDVPKEKLLSKSVETALCRLFITELKDTKKRIQETSKLIKLKNFNLFDTFCMLYSKAEGMITEESLAWFLKKTGNVTRTNDPELFIRRFDLDNDGMLTFEEFKKMFDQNILKEVLILEQSPKKKTITKSKTIDKPKKKLEFDKPIKIKNENDLARRLEEQIRNYRGLENIKSELIAEIDYNLIDSFKILFDPFCKGYITLEEFQHLLTKLGVSPKVSMHALQITLKKYCPDIRDKMTYTNFCEIMLPHDKNLAKILYSRSSKVYDPKMPPVLSVKITMLLKLFFSLFCKLVAEHQKTKKEKKYLQCLIFRKW